MWFHSDLNGLNGSFWHRWLFGAGNVQCCCLFQLPKRSQCWFCFISAIILGASTALPSWFFLALLPYFILTFSCPSPSQHEHSWYVLPPSSNHSSYLVGASTRAATSAEKALKHSKMVHPLCKFYWRANVQFRLVSLNPVPFCRLPIN